jgi:hypothetical protein
VSLLPGGGSLYSWIYTYCRELASELVDEFTSVFLDFRQLEHLELFVRAPVARLLLDSHFPDLLDFKSNVDPSFSEALRSFINRHPTLISLELFRSSTNIPIHGSPMSNFGPMSLPCLTNYSGPGCYASGLVVDTKSLRTPTVTWYADDPSLAPALAALGAGTNPIGGHLALDIFSGTVSELIVLRCVTESMPHVAIVQLYKIITTADRFSLASTLA